MAMTLRLTDAQDAALQDLADRQGISKHEAVVRAIDAQSDRVAVAADVRDWTDYALNRYAGLLDRLAQ